MARKNITINLYLKELVYDIQNKTHLTGRSRFAGNNNEEVANMQSSDDEEDLYQVLRSIISAFGYLKTRLAEYIDDTDLSPNFTLDNLISSYEAGETISIVLNHLPHNFNSAMKDALTSGMHDYIVRRAIGDWFQISNKADSADYMVMSEKVLSEIREAINKRSRPTRPNYPMP